MRRGVWRLHLRHRSSGSCCTPRPGFRRFQGCFRGAGGCWHHLPDNPRFIHAVGRRGGCTVATHLRMVAVNVVQHTLRQLACPPPKRFLDPQSPIFTMAHAPAGLRRSGADLPSNLTSPARPPQSGLPCPAPRAAAAPTQRRKEKNTDSQQTTTGFGPREKIDRYEQHRTIGPSSDARCSEARLQHRLGPPFARVGSVNPGEREPTAVPIASS